MNSHIISSVLQGTASQDFANAISLTWAEPSLPWNATICVRCTPMGPCGMEQGWRMLSYSRITGRGTKGLFRENPCHPCHHSKDEKSWPWKTISSRSQLETAPDTCFASSHLKNRRKMTQGCSPLWRELELRATGPLFTAILSSAIKPCKFP